MKRRIKLTEKELAIGMWLYIKLYIKYHKDTVHPNYFIEQIKLIYLRGHDLQTEWPCNCILCHKHNKVCTRCPLGSCSIDFATPWSVAANCIYDTNTRAYISPFTVEESREACNKIIEAIEKDIPND